MKITYDEKTGAMYIRLLEGKHQCHTVLLSDSIILNIGKNEKLVGIEILDAKQVLGKGKLPTVVLENLSLKSAGV